METKSRKEALAGVATSESGLFVRNATGLVREVSSGSAVVFNLTFSAVPVAFALMLQLGPASYPGGNWYIGVLTALILSVPVALLYVMFVSAIPRSGADYVWISRALHPAVGFMSNLSWTVWTFFYIGLFPTLIISLGVAPLLRILSAYFNVGIGTGLLQFLSTSGGELVFGLIVLLLSGLIILFGRGLRNFNRFQRWAGIFWVAGGVALPVLVLLITSHDSFVNHFNQYISALGGPHNAIGVAQKATVSVPGFNLGQSLLMATLPAFAISFIFQSAYIGGEIKASSRGHLVSIAGAQVFAAICLIGLAFAFLTTVSINLLGSIAQTSPADIGLTSTPLYPELAAIASGNGIVGIIIQLAFMVSIFTWIPINIVIVSRNIFAWSFDRLLPPAVASIHPRTRTPVVAALLILGVGVLAVAFLAFNQSIQTATGVFGEVLTYFAVAIAGLTLAFRQKRIVDASPFNSRVFGVPLFTVVSVVSIVGMAGLTFILLKDPNSGTSLSANPRTTLFEIGIFLVGVPIYYILRAVRRARGVNVDLAYKEIPPD